LQPKLNIAEIITKQKFSTFQNTSKHKSK